MKRLDDKTINYIAIISAIFIFIYECYLKYVFPKPICSIIIQLSYSYIGSYIFYKLLNERDKNNNKEKVENSLVPMLRENVEIYIEFIKIFKTHKHWSTLDKNEFKEMVKGIRCNDILGEYGFFKKEVVYKRTYLEYIQYMFSMHLKTFNGISCNLNILDDKTGKYILEMIRELNKVIPVINDLLNFRNNNQLRQIMNIIYGYHLLIVKFIKRLDEVYILK